MCGVVDNLKSLLSKSNYDFSIYYRRNNNDDLEDYIAVKDKMMADYEDQNKWRKMMLVNIAKAGFFSSDRTIAEYNRDIWKLK